MTSRRAADLTPEQLARRRAANADYMRRMRGTGTNGVMRQGKRGARPNKTTTDELDRRLAVVPTLSQRYFGDPLPGRSVLDKMRAKEQGSTTHHKEATT